MVLAASLGNFAGEGRVKGEVEGLCGSCLAVRVCAWRHLSFCSLLLSGLGPGRSHSVKHATVMSSAYPSPPYPPHTYTCTHPLSLPSSPSLRDTVHTRSRASRTHGSSPSHPPLTNPSAPFSALPATHTPHTATRQWPVPSSSSTASVTAGPGGRT